MCSGFYEKIMLDQGAKAQMTIQPDLMAL